MSKRYGKSKNLVPLTVMITPEQLQRVINLSADSESSMGNVLRKLIQDDIQKLHNTNRKGVKV